MPHLHVDLSISPKVREQWIPRTTCTECGRVGDSGPCIPGGADTPPFSLASVAGTYASSSVPFGNVTLQSSSDGDQLLLSMGPVQQIAIEFTNTSSFAVDDCAKIAQGIEVCFAPLSSYKVMAVSRSDSCNSCLRFQQLSQWAAAVEGARLAQLSGKCAAAVFNIAPEIPLAGISAQNHTVVRIQSLSLIQFIKKQKKL